MKYLRIPWGMRAMKEPGLPYAIRITPCFSLPKRCRNAKSPRRAFGQLSGGKSYAPVFLTPMHRRYSISMRLGLTGRAFCC